jgi:hypothetical protein
MWNYRGANKSLARPGRKQARKHVRDAGVFNNIETRAVIKFYLLQGKAPKEIDAIVTETLACFLPDRAKGLSAPLFFRTQLNFQLLLAVCTSYQQRTHTATRRNIPTPLIFVNVRVKDFSVAYAVHTPKEDIIWQPPSPPKKIGNDYHFNRP